MIISKGNRIALRNEIGRIGLYDAYLSTLGGGENLVAVLAELLEEEFPRAELDIITHVENHVPIEALAERFGVRLERARVRCIRPGTRHRRLPLHSVRRFLHEREIARLSSEYDLFFNDTVFSVAPARSRHSVYMCMFPLTPEPWLWRERPVRRRLMWPYIALRRRLYRRWIGSYDLLVAISNFTQDWIQRIWRLDSELLYPPADTCPELSLDRKGKKILAIGRFFPGNHNKKHDVLIRAMRGLRERGLEGWQLHLVGGRTPVKGTGAYLEYLQSLAQGQPVQFHVDASREVLERLLGASSLFWHATGFGEEANRQPEKLEHFGITTVEAMSRGCVPLVFASGGQPEIIRDGETGFLWRSPEELQERTLFLARNGEARESLARAAHTRSLYFGREAFKNRARNLLRRL